MAVHQNLSEIGWFYHAPEPPKKASSKEIPLASQIPGLNDLSAVPYDNEPRSLLRDTDTKYIRMAKMGGREDLLRFKEPKPKSKEPKPYPRNDWYYLEDNRMEAEHTEPMRPWEFRLPEYMVHDEHKPFGDDYDYKNDPDGKVYWKKGRVAPGTREIKHVSRGPPVQLNHPMSAPSPFTKPASITNPEAQNSRYPILPQMFDAEIRPAMNKLLAYGYANEWQTVRDDWYSQLRMLEDTAMNEAVEHVLAKKSQSGKNSNKTTMTWNDVTKPTNASHRVLSNTVQQKPLFKLSKFEKAKSRVDSHRVLPPIQGNF